MEQKRWVQYGDGMTIWGDDPSELEGMSYPQQCLRCYGKFDGAKVEVIQRYTDCDVFKCPKCESTVDNRPRSWGGSVVELDRTTGRPRS